MTNTDTTRRRMLTAAGAVGIAGLAGCSTLVSVEEEDDPEMEVTQSVMYEIPQYIDAGGSPEYSDDGLRFVDYANIAHGIGIPTTAMRESELGHEDYDASLYAEEMPRLGELWAELVEEDLMGAFTRTFDGRTWPFLQENENGWVREGEPRFEDLQHATYTYHVHHRGGRFAEHDGMFRRIVFTPPDFQTSVGRFILDERRDGGTLYHDEDLTDVDNHSMAYGLASIHAHYYAWTRFGKPDGLDDMTRVPEDELVDFLGYDQHVLSEVAMDIKEEALDDAWNDATGVYEWNGSTYPIDAVGGMIRGTKALYDSIQFWGGNEDAAMEVFDRTVRMFSEIYEADIVQPWGLPSEVEFTENGVEPASNTVDARRTWEFVNHLTGGYGLTRDRFTELLEDNSPETFDHVGEITDELLLGVMEYGLDGGELVSELDYGSGDITDDRRSAAAIGIFLPAAINGYGAGEAFERTDGWGDVDAEVANNTSDLFDVVVDHLALIENAFLIEAQ